MEAFSKALRQLPTIIADNGGYDSSELITQLRVAHSQGQVSNVDARSALNNFVHLSKIALQRNMGLDMYNGCIANMREKGVRESYKSKLQVLVSAAEAAEMILRVDDIIKCAPRQRSHQH